MAGFVQFAGIGVHFPDQVVANSDFPWQAAGVSEQHLARAGVRERRHAAAQETILELAYHASIQAIEHAGLSGSDVDRLILVTSTLQPGLLVPSGAIVLQDRLGMHNGQASTLLETCCGSIIALEQGAAMIRAGMARHVLIVAAETFSKTFHPTSPTTFEIGMSMGDGAGAAVLSASERGPDALIGSYVRSHADFQSGLGMRPMCVEESGTSSAVLGFGSSGAGPTFRGKPLAGQELIEALHWFTTTTVPAAIREVLAACRMGAGDVDFYCLHQPNRMFLDSWKREASIPETRTLDTLELFGNLSSVSVLANLHAAWEQGRLQRDDTVLIAAAGEGASYGAMLWKWGVTRKDSL